MGKEIEKKDSLEYINVLRILALVLVILAHSSAVYTGAWGFNLFLARNLPSSTSG